MRASKALWAAVAVLLFASSVWAQQKPGTLSSFEFQTPKTGMVQQYEAGRKSKAQWHKQQNDKGSLLVWEIVSGDHTGTYIVGREGQHWADLDKPSVPDAADLAEYNKEIGQYVGSLVTRYYNYIPEESSIPAGGLPSHYAEVNIYHVKFGHYAEFRTAISRVTAAIKKTNWNPSGTAGWYEIANGGRMGEFVLVLPHKNWAEFDDQPNVKPFPEMLREGLGPLEAESLMKMFDSAVVDGSTEIVEFRQDLSYIPGK